MINVGVQNSKILLKFPYRISKLSRTDWQEIETIPSRITAHHAKFSRRRQVAPQNLKSKGNLKVTVALILRGRLCILGPPYENYQMSTWGEPTRASNIDSANQSADIQALTQNKLSLPIFSHKGYHAVHSYARWLKENNDFNISVDSAHWFHATKYYYFPGRIFSFM